MFAMIDSVAEGAVALNAPSATTLWIAFIAFLLGLVLVRRLVEWRFPGSRAQLLYSAVGMSTLAAVAFGLAIYVGTDGSMLSAALLAAGAFVALHGAVGLWLTLSGRDADAWHLGLRRATHDEDATE